MAPPKQKPGKSEQTVRTPPEFVAAVERRFGPICWDLACTSTNVIGSTKRGFFFDKGEDAFTYDWSHLLHGESGLRFCNPPFGQVRQWVERAAKSMAADPLWRGAFLLPCSPGTKWFRDHVKGKAFALALETRLTFVGHQHPFPKDLMLCLYAHGMHGFDTWDWKGKT